MDRRGNGPTLIRWAGLAVWLMVGVSTVVRQLPRIPELTSAHPGEEAAVAAVIWGFLGILWLAFGAAFLWLTRGVATARVERRDLVALGVATLVASTLHTDLFLLLAACVPLVLRGRWLRGWIVGQLGLTITVGLAIAGTSDFEPIFQAPHLPASLLVALTLAAVVAWQGLGFAVGSMAAAEARGRIELEGALGDLAATRELLSGTARLAERLRISRDLHDVVGHHLAALSVNLDLAARRADGAAAEAVREVHTVTRLLLQDVREVVHDLRGTRTLDLRAALVHLAQDVREPAVALDLPETLDVDPLRAQALYRCVQEGLTNAVRHGRARRVSIRVARDPRTLLLEIEDDGRGASPLVPGLGLTGMRERVEECGGTLAIDARSGAGVRLRASLPEPEEAGA